MHKSTKITNQQLLKELEKRLPEFTSDELAVLLGWIGKYQSEIMKLIQEKNPRAYSWIQEKYQQLEKEKTDKEIEKMKKSLEKE